LLESADRLAEEVLDDTGAELAEGILLDVPLASELLNVEEVSAP
jgi:hypothetical protein